MALGWRVPPQLVGWDGGVSVVRVPPHCVSRSWVFVVRTVRKAADLPLITCSTIIFFGCDTDATRYYALGLGASGVLVH